jgi:hypothetical protein
MNSRDRFRAVMNFEPFDRLPMVEWATWWDKTIQRWRNEGLPAEVKGRYDIYSHLGMEIYWQEWLSALGPACPKPASHGAPLMADEGDYERLRPHLFPPIVLDAAKWENLARRQAAGEIVFWLTLPGFFWYPRQLFGIEGHLYAFFDQPQLMHRINSDLANWQLNAITTVARYLKPDFMTFAEDMSYNHGPMLSKELFNEFLKPYYHRVIPSLHGMGTLAIIDSDGDITVPTGWFEEAGLDGILPLERQAGVDVARVRLEHPGMRFIGCFDKMTMNQGESAMRAEFERLVPTASRGGLIVSVDHQTPPGVSFEQYKLYLRLFGEYAEKAGRSSQTLLKKP